MVKTAQRVPPATRSRALQVVCLITRWALVGKCSSKTNATCDNGWSGGKWMEIPNGE